MAAERRSNDEMMNLTIEMPASLANLLGGNEQELSRETLKLLVYELFREGKISSGKGAELLGVSRLTFLELLAERQIPFFNYSQADLQAELEAVREIRTDLQET